MHTRGRALLRGAASLLIVPLSIGGIYFSAKAGIAIADRQVPPESVVRPGEIPVGSRLSLATGAKLPAVARELKALREFEFLRSTTDAPKVEGVDAWIVGEVEVVLEVLPGSDRRHLHVLVRGGERDGERVWLVAKDLQAAARP